MRPILALLALAGLAACSGAPALDDPRLSTRDLNLEDFFAGRSVAHGQFQDRFGTVRRRFVVEIEGRWDGETLTLTEDFVYEDGATERRVWRLRKTGPVTADQAWEGTAAGVQGVARGQERGDTFNWRYTIDLPIPAADGSVATLRASFDDWMWQLTDDRLLNRAYMSRAGIALGDVILMFERG